MKKFIKKILGLENKLIIRYFDDKQLLKGEMILTGFDNDLLELMKKFNKEMEIKPTKQLLKG